MIVKTRIVGTSTTITIPSSLHVPAGNYYEPSMDKHGNIIFKKVDKPADEKHTKK